MAILLTKLSPLISILTKLIPSGDKNSSFLNQGCEINQKNIKVNNTFNNQMFEEHLGDEILLNKFKAMKASSGYEEARVQTRVKTTYTNYAYWVMAFSIFLAFVGLMSNVVYRNGLVVATFFGLATVFTIVGFLVLHFKKTLRRNERLTVSDAIIEDVNEKVNSIKKEDNPTIEYKYEITLLFENGTRKTIVNDNNISLKKYDVGIVFLSENKQEIVDFKNFKLGKFNSIFGNK